MSEWEQREDGKRQAAVQAARAASIRVLRPLDGRRDGRGRALNVNARAPQELIALTDQTHLTFILRFVPAKQLREYP